MEKPLENQAEHQVVASCQGIPAVALQEIPNPSQPIQQDCQLLADSIAMCTESGVPTYVFALVRLL